jgi:hypothetical protein
MTAMMMLLFVMGSKENAERDLVLFIIILVSSASVGSGRCHSTRKSREKETFVDCPMNLVAVGWILDDSRPLFFFYARSRLYSTKCSNDKENNTVRSTAFDVR